MAAPPKSRSLSRLHVKGRAPVLPAMSAAGIRSDAAFKLNPFVDWTWDTISEHVFWMPAVTLTGAQSAPFLS